MNRFTSFLTPLIQSYITYQKASEHWNDSSYEANLLLFDRYCKKQYPKATALSQQMVDEWCCQRESESNNSCRSRIYVIVSFIRFLRKRSQTEITEPLLPRKERRTYIPHSFTQKELENFFHACDSLPPTTVTPETRSRKITIPVFFRLLYSTGIRTNEARLLRVDDVDLVHGILNIRYSKGYAQHYIALHDSMLKVLQKYDVAIRKQYPSRNYFFPARNNSFHTRNWVQHNFRELWDKYNTSYATAYQLRHNYATENINQWTDEGFSFDAKLLYLSKSMGHSTLESTKYYYSLVPGMADILEEKTGHSFDDILPEVDYEESKE